MRAERTAVRSGLIRSWRRLGVMIRRHMRCSLGVGHCLKYPLAWTTREYISDSGGIAYTHLMHE